MEHADSRLVARSIDIVLLDLGGVLLRLHDPLDTFGIDLNQEDFLEKWLLSPAVRKLERGDIKADPFAEEIVEEFSLPYSPQEFLQRFERWPDELFDGVTDLLRTIGENFHLAILSNTNAIHWECNDIEGRLDPLVKSVFLSYRTGLVKPEPAAFQDVLSTLDVMAENVLFLDDNRLNIDAARQCGLQARLTRGFDDLKANLREAGVTR
jgi:HAD superfamily hydrolase (TIGR01509 family)